ncbi:uncharacterized protein [Temnothorax longispinosus]|uniref:uncharacterized protein n=1 Tax=Temnothorax longispinosus TaxID=300112 RepID=UPI003A995C97
MRKTITARDVAVISSLTTSAENYTVVWELLKKHYDNKKLIINSHLAQLLDFPQITKNKHTSLKQFIVHLRTHPKALEVLGLPVAQWDAIIIFLARNKLDYYSQRDWEEDIGQRAPEYMPTTEDFLKFLNERCRTLEMLDSGQGQGKHETTQKKDVAKKSDKRVTLASTSQSCPICKGNHQVYNCSDLLKMSALDRQAAVKEKHLCLNCLKTGHYVKICKSTNCRKCSKAHNTLLHVESTETKDQANSSESRKSEDENKPVVMPCVKNTANYNTKNGRSILTARVSNVPRSYVILATAQIYVRDIDGKRLTCRALLDPGSQSHLVTSKLVRRLQVPCKKESRTINGVMQNVTDIKSSTTIRIESCHSGFRADLDCLVLPVITSRLPQVNINKRFITLPEDNRIADPDFDKSGKIDLLRNRFAK